MTTFAVTVTYGNRFHLLKQVMDACYKEGVSKIIVVDNNSSKSSKIELKKYEKENKDKLKVIYLMENLWTEVNKWDTKRDQLSLFYLIWKNNFKNIVLMDENARDKKYFNIELHNKFKHNVFIKKVKNKLFYTKQNLINKLENIKYD